MEKQHDKPFKLDAVQYYLAHKELGVRGSGNYASDEQKEIAHLTHELHDAQDALDVLKKLSAFWENNRSHLSRGF